MNERIKTALFTFGVTVLLGLTVLSEIQHQKFRKQVQAVLEDPEARPDAWTKTADNERMCLFAKINGLSTEGICDCNPLEPIVEN